MDDGEIIRRALLTATLAQFCQIDPFTIKSPVCPLCSEGPLAALPGGQAFCSNDDCPAFTWQITDTPEEYRRNAVAVRITRTNPDGTVEDVTDEGGWPFS